MEETMAKIPQRIHVPRETVDGTQMPAAGLAATICRTAISRNTTECTKRDHGAFAVGENGKSAHVTITLAEGPEL